MGDTDLYLYGVVHAGRRLPAALGGVGSPPGELRLVTTGAIAAVVSAAPAVLHARRRDLLAHRDLLLALAAAGRPVLPMRFGSVAPDEATVRQQLAASAAAHRESLERVAGRFEMNVRVDVAQDGAADVRLGESVAAGLNRRARHAAREVTDDLAALAVESAGCPAGNDCVRSTSFLVDAKRQDAFRAAADRLAARHQGAVVLRVTGPLPCYSFVTEDPVTPGAA
ncbi:hypothetical protein N566_20215 [Streptomycetaceae bacterium MP113-05]|nr:hypothetical protein N566_20215 [Streptomycetaceae bacterium MP113-05]